MKKFINDLNYIDENGDVFMKIAAACQKDVLSGISGKDLTFAFFDIDKGAISSVSETRFAAGSLDECADFLVKNEVDLLLAPQVGENEKNILDNAGIHLICDLCGNVRTLVEAYLSGSLFDNPNYFIK